eukprot:TRINITY_DN76539_c0_g1_i1.p1 TRINITY_DN76539_c0_g1~~TRINITY_DN76539_c0_g1_i1.p1  ORF type:complete len:376 (+),score=36.08 TRINITY_DN76539_c0_g1_i1:74-1129(+)
MASDQAAKRPRTEPKTNVIGKYWEDEDAADTEIRKPLPRPGLGQSVPVTLTYMGPSVPRGLMASGQVGTKRDGTGSDSGHFGVDMCATSVQISNGRERGFTLDANAFELLASPIEHVNYLDENEVLQKYYPKVRDLVQQHTGAAEVHCFDHNVRSRRLTEQGKKLQGGSNVQAPAMIVHNDYTKTSAPRRLRDLAQPPKQNDTLNKLLGDKPLISRETLEAREPGRWAFINVWRNIRPEPVAKYPLGLCDSSTVVPEDLVTFEIHYADRIGENYFAAHSSRHQWYYFPQVTRDEAILIKQWDSTGSGFSETPHPSRATFSLHSAFEDPSSEIDAPDRESIEVRTVVFFDDS